MANAVLCVAGVPPGHARENEVTGKATDCIHIATLRDGDTEGAGRKRCRVRAARVVAYRLGLGGLGPRVGQAAGDRPIEHPGGGRDRARAQPDREAGAGAHTVDRGARRVGRLSACSRSDGLAPRD
jgi:hypothetical protein